MKYTIFNTTIPGIIMFVIGFVNLILGVFKSVIISVIVALGGLFLIAIGERR